MPESISTRLKGFTIRPAVEADVPAILGFIRELAEYEQLLADVQATEETLRLGLFHDRPVAEVLIGEWEGRPVAFALFFHNFSTFVGRAGIYLEDLYVTPAMRGKGIGTLLLAYVAHLAKERNCGRFEWAVLDWNEPALRVYRAVGAVPLDEWTVQRVSGAALDRLAARFDG